MSVRLPQITYGLFLERLCARARVTIVATPFAIGFEHLRIADDAQLAFERALAALSAEDPETYADLSTFGVGHSMGSLLHAIIVPGTAWTAPDILALVTRLMSFNNKPATDAVPLFAEVLAPGLRASSPAVAAVTTVPRRWRRDLSRSALPIAHVAVVRVATRRGPRAAAGGGPDRAGVRGGCERGERVRAGRRDARVDEQSLPRGGKALLVAVPDDDTIDETGGGGGDEGRRGTNAWTRCERRAGFDAAGFEPARVERAGGGPAGATDPAHRAPRASADVAAGIAEAGDAISRPSRTRSGYGRTRPMPSPTRSGSSARGSSRPRRRSNGRLARPR